MALSCFLRKISPTILRDATIGSLKKKVVIPSCSVPCIRQTYFHQLVSNENAGKESSAVPKWSWRSPSLITVDHKQLSTSATLLAAHKGHDHSKLWTFEKILSVSLLPLLPAALISPSQPLDLALALVVVLHTHFGIEAIVLDYVRPILFGNVVPKISLALVYLLSILTFAGLLNLTFNDVGLANTIIQIWKK